MLESNLPENDVCAKGRAGSRPLPLNAADAVCRRLGLLRALLDQRGLRGMCVRETSDIAWLTGFEGVFDEERAHALFVDASRAVLHTDSRYVTACERRAEGTPIAVSAERGAHAKFVARMVEQDADGEGPYRLAIEDTMTLGEFRKFEEAFGLRAAAEGERERLASAACDFVETDGLVVGLRAVKDAGEIARMKAAQAVTDEAFTHIVAFMKPGMTEREVQLELEDYMVRHGAQGLAFSSIVATGANGASPHAVPGDTRLEAGQCVVMDFGARAQGYCSDMTRTVFLGAPEGKMLDAWNAMRRANEEVRAMLRPGVTGRQAHELAERILEEGGFGGRMGHGLGHGVGIDIHEEPVLSPRNDEPLAIGNVVTVEPGIYLPGEFGMRLEDFGVVTADGFETFTRSTHEPVVI